MRQLRLHPDRALPAEPGVRDIARRIYAQTAELPLICMHGHVDAAMLAADERFSDPAELLVIPDHYVTRMLVSQGVDLDALGVPRLDGAPVESDPRAIWRLFCAHWHLFRATPSRYWIEHELAAVLGVDVEPAADSADHLYDQIVERLDSPQFRPRALLRRFGIELLATTDPATSDLRHHTRLHEDGVRQVVPTFRPDALVHVRQPGWLEQVAVLGTMTGEDTGTYQGYLAALAARRQTFLAAGALATDHGHLTADTTELEPAAAEKIFADALRGVADPAAESAFAAHMLFQMARMSCEDGLVMQLHPGVLRDHDPAVRATRGPDVGFDIPVTTEYTRALRPVLERFGRDPRFRLVLFAVDETVYSRELAPIAGVYPAVRLGAPWWFLDSPDGMRRFREAVTETAGFANTSGFVDDTRAFLSIPARHDLARRIDAGHLARLVAEHRLQEDEAVQTAVELAHDLPRAAYAPRS
jgi:glucuronate isomerase